MKLRLIESGFCPGWHTLWYGAALIGTVERTPDGYRVPGKEGRHATLKDAAEVLLLAKVRERELQLEADLKLLHTILEESDE